MKTPTSTPDNSIELNLTSMIDVIFLLLIFFVLTTDFKEPEKLLPTNLNGSGAISSEIAQTQEERDLGKIVARVAVDASGKIEYAIDGKRVDSLQNVEATFVALQEIDPNVPVIVDPDANAPLESVLDVYDCARRAGLAKIKFAASPEALAAAR
ncbi:MAG: biopolymer transporter ExbD [Thermoguttaceae bacterium]|jgi:biopolymer transport protein ExbD|nr:biopolymer transporter ExbD [Thermoguttaceae bacterium]MBR4751761.1 biopolymer transporter ExbD [Thermoguttaceae bacterium]MBR5757346.1 biopolymer transporter ExbD [Thermoguttaceae bacterium]